METVCVSLKAIVPQVLTPSKQRISRAFGRKASTYERHAAIQVELLKQLLPRIASCPGIKGPWADFGCGVGTLFQLGQESGMALPEFVGMDLSYGLLRSIKKNGISIHPLVLGDIEQPPFKPASLGGVVTASALQWLRDPFIVIQQISEVLLTGGSCVFSIFTSGSFSELFAIRRSFERGIPVVCPKTEHLLRSFAEARLTLVEHESITATTWFPDPLALLKSIRGMGGTATAEQQFNRSELAQFCDRYEKSFRTDRGVPLSYKALIGICRKENRS
jgi:malonyl-CoA O-methyltransferase